MSANKTFAYIRVHSRPKNLSRFVDPLHQIQQRPRQRSRGVHLQMDADLESACQFAAFFGQKLEPNHLTEQFIARRVAVDRSQIQAAVAAGQLRARDGVAQSLRKINVI